MNAGTFSAVDYLGEPVIIKRGYQLCALERIAPRCMGKGDVE